MLSDIEATLADSPWLAGKEFSLADIGYAPYITRLDHLQLQFLWDKRPHIPDWYDRLRERRGYTEALEKWFNAKLSAVDERKGLGGSRQSQSDRRLRDFFIQLQRGQYPSRQRRQLQCAPHRHVRCADSQIGRLVCSSEKVRRR